MTKVGVLGYGNIGRAVAAHAAATPGLTLAFIANRSPATSREGVPVHVGDPTDEQLAEVDLVVEAAHPNVVARVGRRVLKLADLLVVSTGGLVDEMLLQQLTDQATEHGRRLLVAQGALVGMDAITAQRWDEAAITMTKAPQHLRPAPVGITKATVLHDGPVTDLAARYPCNVNAMVTFALATLGVNRTRARLVCDPTVNLGSIDITLTAASGASLRVVKEQPMIGVSGSEMVASVLRSVTAAIGSDRSVLAFV